MTSLILSLLAYDVPFLTAYMKIEINLIILHYIVLYCIVLYCIVLYCIVLYCIVLYRVVSCRAASRRVVSHRIASYCIVMFSYLPLQLLRRQPGRTERRTGGVGDARRRRIHGAHFRQLRRRPTMHGGLPVCAAHAAQAAAARCPGRWIRVAQKQTRSTSGR